MDNALDMVIKGIDDLKSEAQKGSESTKQKFAEFEAKYNKTVEELADAKASVEQINQAIADMRAEYGAPKSNQEAKSYGEAFADAIKENAEEIANVKSGKGHSFTVQAKDMTLAGNLTGSAVAQYSLEPSLRGRRLVHFRDIPGVQVIPTATGIWKYYRNAPPASTGSFGTQTEGSAKAQIDYNWQEVTTTVATEAGFSVVSRQMLRDLPFLQGFLPAELREDYLRHEDNKFINNLMAATSAQSISASVYVEKLIEAISVVMSRDYNPTAIVTTAAQWATILNTKPQDYSIPGGVSITGEGQVSIAGVPVVVHNGMTAGKTFVGDFSRVKIIQATGLNVQFFEQDSDNVRKNMVTVRAEADVALAVLRSDWGVYF